MFLIICFCLHESRTGTDSALIILLVAIRLQMFKVASILVRASLVWEPNDGLASSTVPGYLNLLT